MKLGGTLTKVPWNEFKYQLVIQEISYIMLTYIIEE